MPEIYESLISLKLALLHKHFITDIILKVFELFSDPKLNLFKFIGA